MGFQNLIILVLLIFAIYIKFIGTLGMVSIIWANGIPVSPRNVSTSTPSSFDTFCNAINDFDQLLVLKGENVTLRWNNAYITKVFQLIPRFISCYLNLIDASLLILATCTRFVGSLGIAAVFWATGTPTELGDVSNFTPFEFDKFYNVINDFDPLVVLKEGNFTLRQDTAHITKMLMGIPHLFVYLDEKLYNFINTDEELCGSMIFTRPVKNCARKLRSLFLKVPDILMYVDRKLCKLTSADPDVCNPCDCKVNEALIDIAWGPNFDIQYDPDEKVDEDLCKCNACGDDELNEYRTAVFRN